MEQRHDTISIHRWREDRWPFPLWSSEAGSCCLGSRNLGCLEVGRLARSPSHFQAWECAS